MATINTSTILSQPSGGLDPNVDSLSQRTSTALTADPIRLSCASSKVLVVNTLADALNSNDHRLSLREAINIANSTAGNTDIFLRPGTYTISISGANEEANQSGDFDILGNGRLKIYSVGRGATINANGLDRIFDVKNGASLTLGNIGITGGLTDYGGGILNSGSVILQGFSSVYGNTANGGGSGIENSGSVTLQGFSSIYGNTAKGLLPDHGGGGIYNSGSVTLRDFSAIHDNTTTQNGGGIDNYGYVTLNHFSSIYGNTANANGGGISNEYSGSLELNGFSSIHRNKAGSFGGGIINVGKVVILNHFSSVYGNTADANGGGIWGSVTLNDSSSVYNNSPNNIA